MFSQSELSLRNPPVDTSLSSPTSDTESALGVLWLSGYLQSRSTFSISRAELPESRKATNLERLVLNVELLPGMHADNGLSCSWISGISPLACRA